MVLLKIDAECVSGGEFEGDAPRPIDMDRVAGGDETFQGVEVKPGKVHLLRRVRDVQAIETDEDAPVQPGIDPARAALRPQLRQRPAPERPDHRTM
jgi:hypothetical protein